MTDQEVLALKPDQLVVITSWRPVPRLLARVDWRGRNPYYDQPEARCTLLDKEKLPNHRWYLTGQWLDHPTEEEKEEATKWT